MDFSSLALRAGIAWVVVMRTLPIVPFAALSALLLPLLPLLPAAGAEEPAPVAKEQAGEQAADVSPDLEAALAKLKLPGVKINIGQRCVDVEGSVCLRQGLLELVACTKGTKEHESIVVVEAKPSHIHTALLLLGAAPGNPAMRKPIDPEGMRFIDLPPRGGPVDVFLVIGQEKEKPINEFIAAAERDDGFGAAGGGGDEKFPTHTFVFAGSILYGEGDGPRRYICDQSGNLISLSTFGDELLCLPDIHGHANGELMWEVDGDSLPEVGTKVTLRLRPQLKPSPAPPAPSGAKP